tara:strand:- start:12913 stop:13386 length:474 start_codon:yes stop_codon:yes gene_type:complete
MREIYANQLWTANAREARDAAGLFAAEIPTVVDLAYEESPALLPRQMAYCRFPVVDGAGNDPSLLRLALLTTVELLRCEVRTVVACSAGMSRSPTIAIGALAVYLDQSPETVLERANEQSAIDLHGALWIEVCEIVFGFRFSVFGFRFSVFGLRSEV